MIYTSYFARLKDLKENGITPVSVCGGVPEWYDGIQYKKLAPKYWFFQKYKEDGDEKFYIEQYHKEVLSKLNCNTVLHEIANLTHSGDIALICYEKPSDFCHRHLVAEWLRSYGYKCKEFEKS